MPNISKTGVVLFICIVLTVTAEYYLAKLNLYKPGTIFSNAIWFVSMLGGLLYLLYARFSKSNVGTFSLFGYGVICGIIMSGVLAYWNHFHYTSLNHSLVDLEIARYGEQLKGFGLSKKEIGEQVAFVKENPPIEKFSLIRFSISAFVSVLISLLGTLMLKRAVN